MSLLTITSSGLYEIKSDYTAISPYDDAILVAPNVYNVTILLCSLLVCPVTFSKARQNAGIRLNGNAAVRLIGMFGEINGFGYGIHADDCNLLKVRDARDKGGGRQYRHCREYRTIGIWFDIHQPTILHGNRSFRRSACYRQ